MASGREQYLQALASLSDLTRTQAERVAGLLARQGEVQSAQVGRVARTCARNREPRVLAAWSSGRSSASRPVRHATGDEVDRPKSASRPRTAPRAHRRARRRRWWRVGPRRARGPPRGPQNLKLTTGTAPADVSTRSTAPRPAPAAEGSAAPRQRRRAPRRRVSGDGGDAGPDSGSLPGARRRPPLCRAGEATGGRGEAACRVDEGRRRCGGLRGSQRRSSPSSSVEAL